MTPAAPPAEPPAPGSGGAGRPKLLHRDFAASSSGLQYGPLVPVHTTEFRLSTAGDAEIIEITDRVQAAVTEAGVGEGQATAFVRGSTVAITTMEYEPGGIHDLQAMLDRLIPARGDYEHNRLNHDTNSHAHQRASIIGPSEVVPVQGGRLTLGTWQQLVVIDFDDHPRERSVLVQVTS
jgi:secondary thiamine-phosphate synthase enzyme